MRHGNKNKKFGRPTDQRRALMVSLMRSLARQGRVTTTEARAKAIRPAIEKLITRAKTDTLANRRILIGRLGDDAAVKKLMTVATLHKERKGGYLRIVKMGLRKGDAASMAVIEFV